MARRMDSSIRLVKHLFLQNCDYHRCCCRYTVQNVVTNHSYERGDTEIATMLISGTVAEQDFS